MPGRSHPCFSVALNNFGAHTAQMGGDVLAGGRQHWPRNKSFEPSVLWESGRFT